MRSFPCDGELDECGVCNGPGIPEGACDCAGTLPAFARDCDGNCILDEDNDGICDDVDGCVPDTALMSLNSYKLTVEEYNVGALGTTYRFYVNAKDAFRQDFSGVRQRPNAFGDQHPRRHLQRRVQHLLGTHPASTRRSSASSQTWNTTATPRLALKTAGVAGAEDPSLVQDAELATTVSSYFQSWRFRAQREHADGCVMVRVEHGSQRIAHRRTLAGCSNHHHRRNLRHAQLPGVPDG